MKLLDVVMIASAVLLGSRRGVYALSALGEKRSVWSDAWRSGIPYPKSSMYYNEICLGIEAVSKACVAAKRVQETAIAAGEKVESQAKDDASPVTIGDFAVQGMVLSVLAAKWPNDGFVAEESAADFLECEAKTREAAVEAAGFASVEALVQALDLKKSAKERRWILDPIDGTRGFLRGAQFCCALGLAIKGEPVLSIIGCPNLDLCDTKVPGALAIALKGEGAFVADQEALLSYNQQWRPLTARTQDMTNDFRLTLVEGVESSHTNSKWAEAAISLAEPLSTDTLRMDSQAKALMLADGKADCFMRLPYSGYREKVWDVAPAALLVQEAGGIFTDRRGNEIQFNQDRLSSQVDGLLATGASPKLHAKLVASLSKTEELYQRQSPSSSSSSD